MDKTTVTIHVVMLPWKQSTTYLQKW